MCALTTVSLTSTDAIVGTWTCKLHGHDLTAGATIPDPVPSNQNWVSYTATGPTVTLQVFPVTVFPTLGDHHVTCTATLAASTDDYKTLVFNLAVHGSCTPTWAPQPAPQCIADKAGNTGTVTFTATGPASNVAAPTVTCTSVTGLGLLTTTTFHGTCTVVNHITGVTNAAVITVSPDGTNAVDGYFLVTVLATTATTSTASSFWVLIQDSCTCPSATGGNTYITNIYKDDGWGCDFPRSCHTEQSESDSQ